uniref:Uncharacterized protein n=1 Tax=Timema poppense TaxID=170557 RepID=A0A7R9CZT9_TIMPO|nr:unnamed protein product [Timema poppensis]
MPGWIQRSPLGFGQTDERASERASDWVATLSSERASAGAEKEKGKYEHLCGRAHRIAEFFCPEVPASRKTGPVEEVRINK